MTLAEILKFAVIVYLAFLGVWFGTAQPKFDPKSKVRPMLYILVSVSMIVGLISIVSALTRHVPVERSIIPFVLSSFSAAIFKSSLRAIKSKNLGLAFSGIVPGEVVQHGPYRYIRHPLYTAYGLFWGTCAFFSGSVLAALGACIVVIMYIAAARAEERHLMASDLGRSYEDYRRKTGLMIPRLFS